MFYPTTNIVKAMKYPKGTCLPCFSFLASPVLTLPKRLETDLFHLHFCVWHEIKVIVAKVFYKNISAFTHLVLLSNSVT